MSSLFFLDYVKFMLSSQLLVTIDTLLVLKRGVDSESRIRESY